MRHYVLTRATYGPAWDLAANRRRLAITRAVTARTMAAQTFGDWTWLVLLDSRDQLLNERMGLFRDSAPSFVPICWTPEAKVAAAVASDAYHAPWRRHIDWHGCVLQTRLDDDDGLPRDALDRFQRAAGGVHRRTVLMLPRGVRVWAGRYSLVTHRRNAMHTLYTPARDQVTVYDYGHVVAHTAGPVRFVDDEWGWLWVRHRDTLSGHKQAELPISDEVRRAFPVDWPVLEAMW